MEHCLLVQCFHGDAATWLLLQSLFCSPLTRSRWIAPLYLPTSTGNMLVDMALSYSHKPDFPGLTYAGTRVDDLVYPWVLWIEAGAPFKLKNQTCILILVLLEVILSSNEDNQFDILSNL